MRRMILVGLALAVLVAGGAAPAPKAEKPPYPLYPEHFEAVKAVIAGKGDLKATMEAINESLAGLLIPNATIAPAPGTAQPDTAAKPAAGTAAPTPPAPAPAAATPKPTTTPKPAATTPAPKSSAAAKAQKPAQLRELLTLARAVFLFPKAKDRDMALWVLGRQPLCSRFLQAFDTGDDLDGALEVLKTLRDYNPALFDKQYEFCIAYAVVWDQFRGHWWVDKASPMETGTMMATYKFYAENEKLMKIPPSQLPFELAVYVVGTRLTAGERAWGLKYGRVMPSPDALYKSVPWTKVLSPAHGQGLDMPYTLMNMQKVGGVCMEQAYFTESVMRLFCVPAIYTQGRGKAADSGHAWVGSLVTGPKVEWDFSCGRYRDNHYYKGEVQDPTNGRYMITDSIVKMSAALLKAGSIEKIEEGNYYLEAAHWVNKCVLDGVMVGKDTKNDVVQNLLAKSLEASPYNGITWLYLGQLAADKKMNVKEAGFWVDKLFEYTLKDFPDFTVDALERYLECVTDQKQKAAILAKVYALLKPTRPDLAADIKVAEGDIWVAQGDAKNAIMAYLYPMVNFSQDLHVLEKAKERMNTIDQKISDPKKLEPAYVDILKQIAAIRKPDAATIEARDIIAAKLAELRGRTEAEKPKRPGATTTRTTPAPTPTK